MSDNATDTMPTYTGVPEMTVMYAVEGHMPEADDENELDAECLPGIVTDLLRANRADLALPYVLRWTKEYDAAIDALLECVARHPDGFDLD